MKEKKTDVGKDGGTSIAASPDGKGRIGTEERIANLERVVMKMAQVIQQQNAPQIQPQNEPLSVPSVPVPENGKQQMTPEMLLFIQKLLGGNSGDAPPIDPFREMAIESMKSTVELNNAIKQAVITKMLNRGSA